MTLASVTVHQRVRPVRYAFLVETTQRDQVALAASLNTALWGGMFNPIVPVDSMDSAVALFRAFDPDVLVRLCSSALPDQLARRYEQRVIERSQLVSRDNRTQRRHLGLGFDIMPLLRDLHEADSRYKDQPSSAVLPRPVDADGWRDFCAVAYGSFHSLPEQDLEFEDGWCRAIRAARVELLDLTPPAVDAYLPIDTTRHGLRLYGGHASCSSHVLYVGDHRSSADLIEFWNLRATGREVVFVPVAAHGNFEAWIRSVVAEGAYRINDHVDNNADIQKGSSVGEEQFKEVVQWIVGLRAGRVSARSWSLRYGMNEEMYVGDIHVAETEGASGDEVGLLEDSAITPVRMVPPPFLEGEGSAFGRFRWVVDATLFCGTRAEDLLFSFPSEHRVEEVVRRAMCRPSETFRLSRRGLAFLEHFSFSHLHVHTVRQEDVMGALLEGGGYSAKPSAPGRYAELIIRKMGSLHWDCRVLKIDGVRRALQQLSDGGCLTKGNIHGYVKGTWRDDLYQHLFLREGWRQAEFSTIFDLLLEHRMVRPGLGLQCSTCRKEGWYHVSEFAEDFTCRFCFTSQRVPFASAKEWQYRADGLFQLPAGAQGSFAVIVSLWRLRELGGLRGFGYVTGRDIVADGARAEVDFACVHLGRDAADYDLVLGEAKTTDFAEADVQKLTRVAGRFARKPYLAFSTLKDRFSDQERQWLTALVDAKWDVIALTREELDPYLLPDRCRVGGHAPTNLRELSRATVHANVK